MTIFKTWIFKLSNIDQGIHKHKQRFWKAIQDYVIYTKIKLCVQKTLFGNYLFEYKTRFAV